MNDKVNKKISFEEAVIPMIRYYSEWLIELDKKGVLKELIDEIKIREKVSMDNNSYGIKKL